MNLQAEFPAEALWPLVSNTNHFNRDTWLPPVELIGIEKGVRRVRFKLPFHPVEWDEEPFEWSDQAATAADVINLQVFRDLFSNEVLRPGEEISIGSVTLMFTDLRDSTRLYFQIGDAPAFGRVRQHFDELG